MAKLMTEIKLTELDELKTFFELIADNIDCVSEPLKSKMEEWFNSEDKGWVSWSDISPEFINRDACTVLLNGKDVDNVCGYNKILRKVKVFIKSPNRVEIITAHSFSINNDNFANFVEWH